MKKVIFILELISLSAFTQSSYVLWYDKPARDWQREALPLGNGRLGCMVFGGLDIEHIQFNEDSLWIGDEKETGAYQAFGDLYVKLGHSGATNYRRELDISRAVHTVSYNLGGVRYKREYFTSFPAQVLVFRFSADKPASYSGLIYLTDAHRGKTRIQGNRITVRGNLEGYRYRGGSARGRNYTYNIALDYEAQVVVLNEGGTLSPSPEGISFRDCNCLTILLAADTNYLNVREKGWKGQDPHKRITAQLDAAAKRPYRELLQEHIRDYQSLFSRMTLDLGVTDPERLALPTDRRLEANRATPDHDLEELLFQYARYLMISCSRPGSLPANLQGLWNNSNQPPWRCDYHSDVNVEMNYWFVHPANLSDCFLPLAEWVWSIREVRREETWAYFRKRGWAMHAENGIFGGSTWRWSVGDASWIANNLWSHYAFTLDKQYLLKRAYPIMTDLFMFWEDHLKEIPHPKGKGKVLVAPKGFSPEHGPVEDGVSYDQQLAWDLLTNFAEASEELGVDRDKRAKALSMRNRLLGPQIGRWGQLQEWMIDRDDPKDKHRHLSHMIAVFPGRQISPLTTPKLAEAAKVSLNARGEEGPGWSRAWKINLWARLFDGERAYKLIRKLIAGGKILPNLFNTHPPFQIDGNFGYASGVCEMLLQSHLNEIHLLPSLPSAWSSGKVRGMRARGAFIVDMDWKNRELQRATIHSEKGGICKVRTLNPSSYVVKDSNSGSRIDFQLKDGVITFHTKPGGSYLILRR